MTATVTPNSQAISEWIKIFPKQVTENYTSSVTFMKQLTVVAISTITYLKNVFPEDSYVVETFGGIKLRILKKTCRDELAQFLSTALWQAFEAFDKKYLHQLALCFYEDECRIENLVEYHIFEYCYQDDGVTMNVHSKNRNNEKHTTKYSFENVKERTIHMIRACVVIMESCQGEMSSTFDVSLRLYYNENAPLDYQAPGYLSTSEAEDHLDATLPKTIRLGCVETPFHKLVTRCYIKDIMKASHEAIASQNPPMITQPETDTPQESSDNVSASSASEVHMRCPCNKYEGDDLSQSSLLLCQYCKTWQHAACFGVSRVAAAASVAGVAGATRHCCAACGDAGAGVHSDALLAPLSAKKRECLCIFRRTLEWCCQVSAVNARDLVSKFAISEVNASKLMKLLHSHGIIKQNVEDNLDTPQRIQADQLKTVMAKFFQTTHNENVVDRLLAETFASQESYSDPISEVLSPLERVNLQNASNIDRVVDKEKRGVLQDISQSEDLTLNQYREAISNDNFEELATVNMGLRKGVQTRSGKRKINEVGQENRSAFRFGVKSKRAKAAE